MNDTLEVIFDNGGGITVQCDAYAHNYEDAKHAAGDVRQLLDGADPSTWDGNEPESRIAWKHEDVSNGGYMIYTPTENSFYGSGNSLGQYNVQDFMDAFGPYEVGAFDEDGNFQLDLLSRDIDMGMFSTAEAAIADAEVAVANGATDVAVRSRKDGAIIWRQAEAQSHATRN